jgi:DNA polymerase I
VERGSIQKLQEQVSVYASMLDSFCKSLKWNNSAGQFEYLSRRLSLGFDDSLQEIAVIPDLKPHTAKALFKAGYTNVKKIAQADVNEIHKIIEKSFPWSLNDQNYSNYLKKMSSDIIKQANQLNPDDKFTESSQIQVTQGKRKLEYSPFPSPKKLKKPTLKSISCQNFNLFIVDDETKLKEFKSKLKQKKEYSIGLQLDTSKSKPLLHKIISITICFLQKGLVECYIIENEKFQDKNYLHSSLKTILEDKKDTIIANGLQLILFHLMNIGIYPKGKLVDPLIAIWLFNLSEDTKVDSVKEEKILESDLKNINKYKTDDVYTRCLTTVKILELSKEYIGSLKNRELFEPFEMEMKALRVISKLEFNGIGFEKNLLDKESSRIDSSKQEVIEFVKSNYGHNLGDNSPKKLSNFLFNVKKFPCKNRSTDEKALIELKNSLKNEDDKILVEKILRFRKLKSRLEKFYNPYKMSDYYTFHKSGTRIHSIFSQRSVATGRLTSTNPNLQNVPNNKDFEGVEIFPKKFFVSRENFVLLSADYASIEFRILASTSDDEELIKYINDCDNSNIDIFKSLASKFNGKSIENVTSVERSKAKTLYALLYGQSVESCSKTNEIPLEEVVMMKSILVKLFPVAFNLEKHMIEKTKKEGFVKTVSGNGKLKFFRSLGRKELFNTLRATIKKKEMLHLEKY